MQKFKSFSVYGLFGTKDIHIPFNDNTLILIGENGIGKTQLLNIFYYTLTKNFIKLSEFIFTQIKIEFSEGKIDIHRNEIEKYMTDVYRHPMIKEIIELIGVPAFESLRSEILMRNTRGTARMRTSELISGHPAFLKLKQIGPIDYIIDIVSEMEFDGHGKKGRKNDLTSKLEDWSKTTDKYLNGTTILYFPTFRMLSEKLIFY